MVESSGLFELTCPAVVRVCIDASGSSFGQVLVIGAGTQRVASPDVAFARSVVHLPDNRRSGWLPDQKLSCFVYASTGRTRITLSGSSGEVTSNGMYQKSTV